MTMQEKNNKPDLDLQGQTNKNDIFPVWKFSKMRCLVTRKSEQ